MSENTINLLQAIGVTLQMINGGIGAAIKNPVTSLLIGAVIGGYQFYVQTLGNKSIPQATKDVLAANNLPVKGN